MKFELYSNSSGDYLNGVSSLSFGQVIQGQHCSTPILFRAHADIESSVSDMELYLESDGGWSTAEFGYYKSPSFESGIQAGSSSLSNHFVETPDATQGSPNGITIDWTGSYSDYIWLDVEIPSDQTGNAEVTYRVIYNYS